MYYGTDDGVAPGNTNLRVAYSADNRATWNGMSNTSHTTSLTAPPTEIRATALAAGNPVLTDGQSMYIALARATGTTENTLGTGTSVDRAEGVPTVYELSQNYPNPFNPTTTIRYSLPVSSNVTLSVFDVLGKEVATLVNGNIEAGVHSVQFNGADLSSGIYFYTLRAGSVVENKKMFLIK
jgi:hypothetical protein